jgi:hypothetical protein
VLLFGLLALLRLPIQLLPDTRQPELFIAASWREAAPAELEEAIIEPIEEAMRGLPGMVEMRSESNRGRGRVGLTFEVGTDMTRVMLDVVSRVNLEGGRPPAVPAGRGGDTGRARGCRVVLVPQRRAGLLHHAAAHVRVEHARTDRRGQGGHRRTQCCGERLQIVGIYEDASPVPVATRR